jgi:E1A/CREB-binding protein
MVARPKGGSGAGGSGQQRGAPGQQAPGQNPMGHQQQVPMGSLGGGGGSGALDGMKREPGGGSGMGLGGGNAMMSNGAPVIRGAAAAGASAYGAGPSGAMKHGGGGMGQVQQHHAHHHQQMMMMQQQQAVQMRQMEVGTGAAPTGKGGKGKKMTAAQLKAAREAQQKQQMMMMKQQQAMAAQQQANGRGGMMMKGAQMNQQMKGPNLAGMTPQQAAAAQQKYQQQRAMMAAQAQRQGQGGQPGQPMTEDQVKKAYIVKQQRWLLFLRHASKCQAAEGRCQYTPHCHVAKKLWEHVLKCTDGACQYPRCLASRELLKHHQNCKDARCPVCGPVRSAMLKQRSHMLMQQQQHAAGAAALGQGPAKRARTDASGQMIPHHAGPLPTAVRGSVGQKRPGGEGTSLLECFSPDEVRTHLASLRLSDANPAAKGQPMSARRRDAESEKAIAGATEQACRACAIERLTFEPPPLYCYSCVGRIKRGQVYYHIPPHVSGGEVRKDAWCNACYNAINGSIEVEGNKYAKSQLAKKKNDDDLEEPWVQCDYCNGWYHQICVLFNGRRNEGGEAPFTCPSCILSQLDKKERTPTTTRPSSQLPATTLPQTRLSYFLEERLRKVMGHERNERARALGKPVEEVPAAEGLTIRVVSSVEKRLETKKNFAEAFKDQNYPAEFPYRSKVLLLFQKIEGVDVCLLGIYVQEYGSDCPAPNNRRVYLSYLDSVKYFRPSGIQVAVEGGGALRTYCYHQILIGYLQYIKQRGFASCFIWACPPFQGEDYILYCHPKEQKTPKSDKLREWYLKMLRQAQKEGIVLSLGNLHDEYKLGNQNHDIASATELPYFDGDYFPGVAEDWIPGIIKEQADAAKRNKGKKGASASSGSAAARKSGKGKRLGAGTPEAELDVELMKKLGTTIANMRHDFIMVHLAHQCANCRKCIADDNRWYDSTPASNGSVFEMCQECYDVEQALPAHEKRLTANRDLVCERVEELPDIKEDGEIMESEFFDTRQAFLSLCQGNHFQFDSLRRAKHTTMMVLYHLNNPSEPAFVATCNVCQRELEPGKGWRCETCADFDICEECRITVGHEHALVRSGNKHSDRGAGMTEEDRRDRAAQIQRTMELLVHATTCQVANCGSPNCTKVKHLFKHAMTCQVKAGGGCQLCRKMWTLLQVHSKGCKVSNCPVPRCRDLKEYRRRAQDQVEERRRQQYRAYMQKQAGGG